jgi:hypothetical protein
MFIDIAEIRRWGWLSPGAHERVWRPGLTIFDGTCYARLKLYDELGELLISFSNYQYKIELAATAARFGGKRWWLICPLTGKKARKLYWLQGQNEFRHRLAIDPPFSYATQRTSGLNRVMQRRNVAAQKLQASELQSGGKPKWMRWKTYARLVARSKRLEKEFTSALLRRVLPRGEDPL